MINAKQELLEHIKDRTVLCAVFEDGRKGEICLHLSMGYEHTEWELFLNALDRTYDDSYGTQELFGTIWYTDGTWSERGEYDGAEWWEHRLRPTPPNVVRKLQIEKDDVIELRGTFLQ